MLFKPFLYSPSSKEINIDNTAIINTFILKSISSMLIIPIIMNTNAIIKDILIRDLFLYFYYIYL